MQLALQIVQVGDESVDRTETTRDISSGGVSFVTSLKIDLGGRIEYVITLSGSNPPVRIRCLGKVIRRQDLQQNGLHEVAVTMERYSFVKAQDTDSVSISA